MVVKANEIVVDALEDIVVQADEAPIEQSEGRAAIRALNDMMLAWDAIGINLGYTVVSSLGDEITVPLGAMRGIKANLAIELAPKYDVTPTPALVQKAREGYAAIIDLAVDMSSSELPSTLPTGSGNDNLDYASDRFYPDQQDTILTETGGSIALEEDTET